MRKRLLTLALTGAALLVPAGAAGAATSSVDGPSADIPDMQSVDVDMAPDGTAALAYLKQAGGMTHVYVSRYVNGAWTAAERVDTGLNVNPSRNVSVAVANGGKVVVSFLNAPAMLANGNLWTAIKPNSATPFAAPGLLVSAGGKYADLDLAPNGNGYAAIGTFGNGGTSVFAKRLEGSTWSPVGADYPDFAGGALDQTEANGAGEPGAMRGARVASAGDGASAVVTFTEETNVGEYAVIARRLTGTTRGPAVQANVPAFGGFNAASAGGDMADVDIDGAGTAWVVWRQGMEYAPMANNPRCLARPLTGNAFGNAQLIDALPTPLAGNACEFPRIDVNADGEGIAAGYHQMPPHDVDLSRLTGGTWSAATEASTADNDNPARTAAAMGENGSGLIAWRHDPGGGANVKILARTTLGGLGTELTLSNNAFGSVGSSEIEAAADTGEQAVVAFVQGAAANARVVAAVVDLPRPTIGGDRPEVTGLRLSRKRFRLGRSTTIRFAISKPATARITFKRALPGRRAGGKCRKPTRRNRARKRCTRLVAVKGAVLSRKVDAGTQRIRFKGRISRRRSLKPGRYQLTLRARDGEGNVSTPDRARFTLLP